MSKLTRREFLERSMLAATAAVASSAVALPALAQEQSSSPGERLRVACLGVNGRGGDHLRYFSSRQDTEVAVVCDPDEQVGNSRAEGVQNVTGNRPRYVKDLREVMDDPEIDIVSIATPNHWHALAAIWAIQAGKDVYVEKPVSHNVSEGRRIVQAARRHNRICQTGTQVRASAGVQRAIQWLREGNLGQVQIARGLCYKRRGSIGNVDGPQQVPEYIDYDLWTGPAAMEPLMRRNLHYDWHWVWNTGNGDLGNQGIHQMDLARWALGVDRLPDEVFTIGGRLGYIDDGNTANTEITFLKYGEQQLIFEVRGLETQPYRGAGVGDVIHCSDGYLVISSYSNAAAFDLDGNMIESFEAGGDHYGNFLEAVRSRDHTLLFADIEQGHLSSALCHLGNISYRMGETAAPRRIREIVAGREAEEETFERMMEHVEANGVNLDETPLYVGPRLAVDPLSETFVDNPEADALLTREYREGFVVPGPEAV